MTMNTSPYPSQIAPIMANSLNDLPSIEHLLDHVAMQLKQSLEQQISKTAAEPCVIGIHTAGVWVAEALQKRLGFKECWSLNPDYYRDDFQQRGLGKNTLPSNLPASIEGRHIILVDDVIFTGRTVRAAMNELFDYGRPASIQLLVLLDRGGRQLPICANMIGATLRLTEQQHIKLKDKLKDQNQQLVWEMQTKDD